MKRIAAVSVSVCFLATLPLLSGCGLMGGKVGARSAAKTEIGVSGVPRVSDELIAAKDAPAEDAPRPKSDSIGIMIAYPVVDKATTASDARDFAGGIGYYLTDAVAGAPEFGQSPLRTTVEHVAWERNLKNLHLSQNDALRVARASGATHVAVAEYKETASSVQVVYHIYAIQANGTISATPTDEFDYTRKDRVAIIQSLPDLARDMRLALDKKPSAISVPPLDGVTPDILAQIGACADKEPYSAPNPKMASFLMNTGKRIPLAAQLALFAGKLRGNRKTAAPYAEFVRKSLPQNTQALGDIAYAVPASINSKSDFFYQQSDTYADNYALSHAAAWMARSAGNRTQSGLYTERSAQNAPANPEAHLTYGWELSEQADRVRQGRQYGDINGSMAATIEPLYQNWYQEVKAATLCDPLYGKAYQRLASAATFAGDSGEADDAMTMARKLNVADPFDTYMWAMEMYAPKWGGDSTTWHEVAAEATTAHYATPGQTIDVYKQLGVLGFADEQKAMRERLMRETTAAITKDPKDDTAHFIRGSLLEGEGRRGAATPDFEANAFNNPDEEWAQADLARHYAFIGRWKEAEKTYRKIIAMNPDNAVAMSWLGYVLKHEGKYAEAEKVLKQAQTVMPNDLNTLVRLGAVYMLQKKYKQAIPVYKQARQVSPLVEEVNVSLAGCYISLDQYQEAVDLGELALKYTPESANAMHILGQAYAGNKQWDEAEEMNKTLLDKNEQDYHAHIFLGDAYAGKKNIAEARKEWQTALKLGPEPEFKKYTEDQLKKYPGR